MQSGCVRPIEYEVVSLDEAAKKGLLTPLAVRRIGTSADVAVVRCVDGSGKRLTVIGDAGRFGDLLASGKASDPRGLVLSKEGFPRVLPGWQPALIDQNDDLGAPPIDA